MPTSVLRGIQAIYYVASGLWPVMSPRTFQALTGAKRDEWLMKTVGVLTVAMGLGLLTEGRRGGGQAPLGLVGALGLGLPDLWYGLRRRVPAVYLLDGALETAFAVGWIRWLIRPAPAESARGQVGPFFALDEPGSYSQLR